MATPEKYITEKLDLIRATLVGGLALVRRDDTKEIGRLADAMMVKVVKDVRAVYKYGVLVGSKGTKK